MNAIVLSEFFRSYGIAPSGIGDFFEGDSEISYNAFMKDLTDLVTKLKKKIIEVIPSTFPRGYLNNVPKKIERYINEAKDYYFIELEIYQSAYNEAREKRDEDERKGRVSKLAGYINHLLHRMATFRNIDWISFFSDRNVLPGYAFPIHNVSLDTSRL